MAHKDPILRFSILLFIGFSSIGFQNWNYIDLKEATIGPVNEQIRLAHARELLGKYYKGQYAVKVESTRDLNQQILNEFQRRLPKKYKKLAPQITKTLIEEAEQNNFDPVFLMALIKTESGFDPKIRGQFGEIGLMQLKPDTAKWIAEKTELTFVGPKTLENPVLNIKLGVAYMTFLRNSFKGTASQYLTAYNMGPGRVRKLMATNHKPKDYATRVMSHYKDFYSEFVLKRTPAVEAQL